jgi:hypothetical protein
MSQAEVGIGGKHRLAAHRFEAIDGPVVGSHGAVAGGFPPPCWPRCPRRQIEPATTKLLVFRISQGVEVIRHRIGSDPAIVDSVRHLDGNVGVGRHQLACPLGTESSHQSSTQDLARPEPSLIVRNRPREHIQVSPLLGLDPNELKLERQSIAMVGEKAVHSLDVGSHDCLGLLVMGIPFLRETPLKPDRPREEIAPDGRRAEDLGEPAGGDSTAQLHLPETILGMHEPLREEQIACGLGEEMWHPPAVANDLDGMIDSRQTQLALQLG